MTYVLVFSVLPDRFRIVRQQLHRLLLLVVFADNRLLLPYNCVIDELFLVNVNIQIDIDVEI